MVSKFNEVNASIGAVVICLLLLCVVGCNAVKTSELVDSDVEIVGVQVFSESAIVEEEEFDLTDDLNEYDQIEYVDNQIEVVTVSTIYQEADEDEREQIIGKLLLQLQEEGAIKNYMYDNDCLFSFQYLNGTLGGVRIKEFGIMFDDIK